MEMRIYVAMGLFHNFSTNCSIVTVRRKHSKDPRYFIMELLSMLPLLQDGSTRVIRLAGLVTELKQQLTA